MKNLLKLFLVLIMSTTMVIASKALGNEHSLILNVTGEKQIDLHLTGMKGKVRLYLTNSNGGIIHDEKFKAKQEMKIKLDLARVADGFYSLVIRDEAKQQSVPLIIKTGEVQVEMSELSKTYFPRVKVDDELVTVRLLSNASNDLHVVIHSNGGELLYDEKIDGVVGLICKQFKFLPGSYKLTLTSDNYSEVKYYSFY